MLLLHSVSCCFCINKESSLLFLYGPFSVNNITALIFQTRNRAEYGSILNSAFPQGYTKPTATYESFPSEKDPKTRWASSPQQRKILKWVGQGETLSLKILPPVQWDTIGKNPTSLEEQKVGNLHEAPQPLGSALREDPKTPGLGN